MKKYIIFLLLIIVCCKTYDSQAQAKPLIANCEGGAGCTFTISDANYDEVDIVLGADGRFANMSHDAMIVFPKVNGKFQDAYIESKLSRSALDRLYGGDGYTQIYVFDPRIQPLDGDWKATVGTTSASECMVDVAGIVKRSLQGVTEKGHIVFKHPFKINALLNSPHAKWRMINPTQYRAVIDFGGGAGGPMKLTYDVSIKNNTRIEGVFSFIIKVPTKDPCTAMIPVTYICQKIDAGQLVPRDDIDPFKEKKKFDIDRLPDDRPKANVDRLPDDRPKGNVDRLPDDKPKGNVDRLPDDDLLPPGKLPDGLKDGNKKPYVERLPDKIPVGKVDRLPDDRPTAKIDRLPDDRPKAKVDRLPDNDLLPSGELPTGLKSPNKQPYIERLPDKIPSGNVDRLPDDNKIYIKRLD